MGRFDRFFEGERHSTPKETAAQGQTHGLPDVTWLDEGVYLMEKTYAIGDSYGSGTLSSPDEVEIMRHFGADGPTYFLDLETTGLAGGTGTYAFLCGLGSVQGDRFAVRQFFLEGPSREHRWLDAIAQAIPANATLVTYNGRCFDLPLLRTRHILSRTKPSWDRCPHIDILYHTRRLYRGRFDSCSLGSMERHVLGLTRAGIDIPGYLIPTIYVEYLRTRDAAPLCGVFYHNCLDIASLAAFYCHVSQILSGTGGDGGELLKAGDIWAGSGHAGKANALWEAAAIHPGSRADAYARQALASKKNADYKTARNRFHGALEAIRAGERPQGGGAIYYEVLEELAKLEEHRFRNYRMALEHTDEALAWLRRNRHLLGGRFTHLYHAMARRAERLRGKIEDRMVEKG